MELHKGKRLKEIIKHSGLMHKEWGTIFGIEKNKLAYLCYSGNVKRTTIVEELSNGLEERGYNYRYIYDENEPMLLADRVDVADLSSLKAEVVKLNSRVKFLEKNLTA